jgi:parallel beta-helix repeat protein/predicted outer membrane repeat protein
MTEMKTNKKLIILPILIMGLAIIFSFSVQSVAASSSNIYVNTSGNDSYSGQSATFQGNLVGPKKTIKNAVSTVSNSGTIYIANGVYKENTIYITKNMNIIGENPDSTIIDAQNQGSSIFITQNNINLNVENIYFTNGTSRDGGAISNSEGTLTVNNCKFFYNHATTGGAIYSNSNTININNSGFSTNRATNGGAIFISTGNLNINNCIFTRNVASTGTGGSIYDASGNLIINNGYFVNNNAVGEGAAIHKTGYLKIVNSNFVDNKVTQNYGGAIYHTGSTITINNSKFSGNNAPVAGAILNVLSPMTITSSNFTGNVADGRGGAIVNTLSNLSITGSYFISNIAEIGFGGALYHSHGVLTFSNNTFSRNTAPDDGAGIYVEYTSVSKIDKNIFTYNKSGRGSALYDFNGIINVTNSNFSDNSAGVKGGAVYNDNTGLGNSKDTTLNFSKCIFHGNVATQFGGALYNGGTINLSYCTLTNNKATNGRGGAIANAQGVISMNHSTVCYNSAGIYGGVIYSNYGHLSITYNTFHDNTGIGVSPYQTKGIYYCFATATIANNTFI